MKNVLKDYKFWLTLIYMVVLFLAVGKFLDIFFDVSYHIFKNVVMPVILGVVGAYILHKE